MNGGTSSIEQLPNEITKNNVVMSVEDKVNNSTINHMQQQGLTSQQQQGLMPQQQQGLMSQQQQGLMPQQQQGLMPQQQQGTQQPGMMEQQRSMPHQQGGQQPGLMPQQNAINTVVSGLQNMQYSTDLPNRDIPMNTNHITHDNTTRPNYVPEADPEKMDYIGEEESLQDMIDKNRKQEKEIFEINDLYDELTTPILVMILYFIFQLPFLKKIMLQHLPSFFSADKNLNFSGYFFKTAVFGGSFYSLTKLIKYAGTFE